MSREREHTEAGKTELSEEDLDQVQGGAIRNLKLPNLKTDGKSKEVDGFKAGADLHKN